MGGKAYHAKLGQHHLINQSSFSLNFINAPLHNRVAPYVLDEPYAQRMIEIVNVFYFNFNFLFKLIN